MIQKHKRLSGAWIGFLILTFTLAIVWIDQMQVQP